MTDIDLEVHRATEALLREAFGYLLRLPAVPTTVDLARKIRSHLDNPRAIAASTVLEGTAASQRWDAVARTGVTRYLPSGIPELVVSASRDEARVSSPAAQTFGRSARGREFAKELTQQLAVGVTIELRPRTN